MAGKTQANTSKFQMNICFVKQVGQVVDFVGGAGRTQAAFLNSRRMLIYRKMQTYLSLPTTDTSSARGIPEVFTVTSESSAESHPVTQTHV